MKQKPKRKKSIIVRLVVLAFSVYIIATLIGLGNELAEVNAELEKELAHKVSLEIGIAEYEDLLKDHNAIIEKAARERLGYVYPNEVIYQDISGN